MDDECRFPEVDALPLICPLLFISVIILPLDDVLLKRLKESQSLPSQHKPTTHCFVIRALRESRKSLCTLLSEIIICQALIRLIFALLHTQAHHPIWKPENSCRLALNTVASTWKAREFKFPIFEVSSNFTFAHNLARQAVIIEFSVNLQSLVKESEGKVWRCRVFRWKVLKTHPLPIPLEMGIDYYPDSSGITFIEFHRELHRTLCDDNSGNPIKETPPRLIRANSSYWKLLNWYTNINFKLTPLLITLSLFVISRKLANLTRETKRRRLTPLDANPFSGWQRETWICVCMVRVSWS